MFLLLEWLLGVDQSVVLRRVSVLVKQCPVTITIITVGRRALMSTRNRRTRMVFRIGTNRARFIWVVVISSLIKNSKATIDLMSSMSNHNVEVVRWVEVIGAWVEVREAPRMKKEDSRISLAGITTEWVVTIVEIMSDQGVIEIWDLGIEIEKEAEISVGKIEKIVEENEIVLAENKIDIETPVVVAPRGADVMIDMVIEVIGDR
jgi:hypothetical protein